MTTEPLGPEADENYDRFIVEALDNGCVWGLEGPEGWALCPSEKYVDSDVMPFWSQPEFAERHCAEEWQGYEVIAISTEEFIEDWLPGMHEDVFLVGVNWDAAMEGTEVEPLDLLADLEEELK
ncbi:DUF2750 domain-containing protein [Marinibactrum halimedae]|uniref:DUF2750 domain-containing protein n=1 Tax=Marinibactrum halimedae TaxID=1444977 RepID=A0AA37WMB8_9GAMM|nr:DUF2750 domain-containing protein [Marinibactrum halimedae]MCD9457810.1 DUF2750 domain-containing protein [Marinibactrum halimedae]GLS24816.1 hypothetical protein GCM10007877_05300 [Marinibactrum halimedae]